jgi:hypothetical protein
MPQQHNYVNTILRQLITNLFTLQKYLNISEELKVKVL